jgi:hypothetical protein
VAQNQGGLELDGESVPTTFAMQWHRRNDEIRRVIELEVPNDVRSTPIVEVVVSMDVPVFDSSLECKVCPWISGAAAIRP